MKIKFTKPLALVDGEGKVYSFKEGKTYELADYWALQLTNSGEAQYLAPPPTLPHPNHQNKA